MLEEEALKGIESKKSETKLNLNDSKKKKRLSSFNDYTGYSSQKLESV